MNRLFRNGAPNLGDYAWFGVFVLIYALAIGLVLAPGSFLPGKDRSQTPYSLTTPSFLSE